MKKLGIIAVAALSLGLTFSVQSATKPATAQAKTKVTVVWQKKMTQKAYQINESKAAHAYAYTGKLAKKVFKLSNYPNTTFYAKGHEALKVNGKTRVYYYIQSASNKKKAGWVWRGYLTTPSMSGSTLMKTIANGTDLQPASSLLKQPASFYTKYAATLKKNFNLTGKLTNNTNDQIRVYVAKSQLKTYATKAMSVWNAALGQKVFITGTATKHDLILSTQAASDWDGLNDGSHIYLSSTALADPTYVDSVADTPQIRELYTEYEKVAAAYKSATDATTKKANYDKGKALYNELIAAQKAAAPEATTYWESVLVHEMGHSLGLDHTPYLTDIMYAETSDDGFSSAVTGKYSWNAPKDTNDSRRETPSVSARDIARAKLAEKLGYW
jgi:hypothetical protein